MILVHDRGMPISVNIQTVHPRKLAAVRREVAPGAVGSAWGPAIGKVWPFIRSQPGLWTDGHNIFLYHHPTQPGTPILCEFGLRSGAHLKRRARCTRPKRRGAKLPSPSTTRRAQSHARGARRDPKMDGGESEGVRWALLGDIRRSDTGSGRH